MTQKWPLVSLFPNAREVAASAESASVDSPAPANGIQYCELSPDRHPNVIGSQFSWFAGIVRFASASMATACG